MRNFLVVLIIIAIVVSWPLGFSLSGFGFAFGAATVLATALGWRRMKVSQLIAHIGLGICIMGIAGTALGHEHMAEVKVGQRFTFAGYAIQYERPFNNAGSNFIAGGAVFNVEGVGNLMPSRRYFPVSDKWTTEAVIHTTWLGDLFISTGVPDQNKSVSMRIRWQPLQVWIWLGAALIMLGGLVGAVQILSLRVKHHKTAPSPLAGEGWGEGEKQ